MTDPIPAIFTRPGCTAQWLRDTAWERTPLGHPDGWDPALRTLVPVILASNQPMFVAWGEQRTLVYNAGYAEILGQKHPQALGRDFLDVWHEIRTELAPMVAAAYRGEPVRMDDILLWMERNGYREETHFAFFYSPVRNGSGAVAGFFCACTEITAQVVASERVELALDAGAIVGTWVWTVPDNRFIADERFAATFDLDPELCRAGLPLEAVAESVHAEDWPHVEVALADALARGGPYRCEYRVRQRGGAYRWIEANGRVELGAEGRAVRFPGVLLDIEDRRRAEAERDHTAALLKTFIEAVPGVVYAKDRGGRLLVANHGTSKLLGLPPEQFIGKTDRDVLADPHEAEAVMAVDRRIMDSGIAEQIEEWFQLPDGTPALWWSTKAPLRDASGEVVGLIGSSVDITDRKRAEDALRLSEQRAAIAMEVAQLGTWEWDVRAGAFSADERCRRMSGLAAGQERFGIEEVRARVHPEDWPMVQQALERSLQPDGDGVYAAEFRWVHADGSIVWTASRGVLHASATEDGTHQRATMLGSMLDVTERRQLLEVMKQADRRKDDFLAMLAHELRNPLAPINTAAHLLRLSGDPSKTVARASEIIGRQVGHLTRLVDDLLDVSRVTRGLVELDRAPVDMHAVVAAAVEQAKPLVQARGHQLRMALGGAQCIVDGDFHRLVQVVSNLLNNAAKYTPQGGVIEIRLDVDEAVIAESGSQASGIDAMDGAAGGVAAAGMRAADVGAVGIDAAGVEAAGVEAAGVEAAGVDAASVDAAAAPSTGAAPGRVIVQVRDNGAGIPADLLPRVFDLFTQAERTPDRAQGGLGIGLALVRSMVQLHHGEVEASSAGPEQGSTFSIRLPRITARAQLDHPAVGTPSASTIRQILIVDDNADAAATLAEMLQMLGHQVATADGAHAALALAADGPPWDTYILDIGLPEMNGYELGSRIRKLPGRASAVLIALTGYGQAQDRAIAKAAGFDHHLVKPADINRLVEILDRR